MKIHRHEAAYWLLGISIVDLLGGAIVQTEEPLNSNAGSKMQHLAEAGLVTTTRTLCFVREHERSEPSALLGSGQVVGVIFGNAVHVHVCKTDALRAYVNTGLAEGTSWDFPPD